MPKLLIEIELAESDLPRSLTASSLYDLLYGISDGQVKAEYQATVTDDNGEIVRESE